MQKQWETDLLIFLSTPSVGRATDCGLGKTAMQLISIHALCGEGDKVEKLQRMQDHIFLSTPSVGRATGCCRLRWRCRWYFYPRPPWGGRQHRCGACRPENPISIHALRGEGDGFHSVLPPVVVDFYPRPPWGGRPVIYGYDIDWIDISIHALRGEGDRRCKICPRCGQYFYPRPPWGGRQPSQFLSSEKYLFLSTPSVGRATTILCPQ